MNNKGFNQLNNFIKNKITAKQYSTGFTLIEILIASFVILIGVVASYFVVQEIFSQTFDTSTRLTAIYLAKEGAEVVRNLRDTGWLQNLPWGSNGIGGDNTFWEADYTNTASLTSCSTCTGSDSDFNILRFIKAWSSNNDPFYDYSGGSNTIFKRRIHIERPGGNVIKVTVDVMWQDLGIQKVTIENYLYDWKL